MKKSNSSFFFASGYASSEQPAIWFFTPTESGCIQQMNWIAL